LQNIEVAAVEFRNIHEPLSVHYLSPTSILRENAELPKVFDHAIHMDGGKVCGIGQVDLSHWDDGAIYANRLEPKHLFTKQCARAWAGGPYSATFPG
jgi:hypothetical protein